MGTVAIDPDTARAVDAGMLRTRVPNQALRSLSVLVENDLFGAHERDSAPGVELD